MKKLRDIDFIQGKRQESFETRANNKLGKVEHYFVVTKDGETREFEPLHFLNLILEAYYEAADRSNNYKKQLVALANAESQITRYILNNGLNRGDYNFSDLFSDIDITRRKLNAYASVNKERNEWFRTVGATLIGVTLAAILSYIFSSPNYIRTTIVIPKTDTIFQLKHDTIFVKVK
ncbi:hypothetical protein [Flavobacterium sp.]|uniref:hypothetical protein n=1 Tax=Flavobacterium sp. TaxID=239 RepID=UPI0025DB29C3|nr:hypothetical protein [Flavobacterium sp.]